MDDRVDADPNCNLYADIGAGVSVAVEIADPVENDTYPVGTGEVTVSSFVTPAWFDPSASEGARFDHLGKVHGPFQMTKGGYVVLFEEGKVKQVFGEEYPEWRKASKRVGVARTARRTRANKIA
jgi:hypothetical protein